MYSIFEKDDEKNLKGYDLYLGHFETLAEATAFAKHDFDSRNKKVNIYIALTAEYEDGNYNIIAAFVKPDFKAYYLFEKGEEKNYKKYSLTDLIEMFEPAKDEDDEYISEDDYNTWNSINNIEDFNDYLNKVINNNAGMHYHDYLIELSV